MNYIKHYDVNKTFVENLHDCIKLNGLVYDKDYIEIDLGEYIAFCPFVFDILGSFPSFFSHCVTMQKRYFKQYFDVCFYSRHDLKVFFFKKSTKLIKSSYSYDSYETKDLLWEFTCWISMSKYGGEKFYHFHDYLNYQNNSKLDTSSLKEIINTNYEKIKNEFLKTKKYETICH